MKERIFIFGALGLLLAILVGLNAASYVQREKIPDSEAVPNRSTYATGPTGTRAFYDLVSSTRQEVIRWENPISELNESDDGIMTFVIIGRTRRPIEADESQQILQWVKDGGRLVVIDRNPPEDLLKTTGSWLIGIADDDKKLTAGELEVLLPSVDPSNSTQMTSGEPAAKPLQPTPFSLGVNAIQPSKFVTSVMIDRIESTIPITGPADNRVTADPEKDTGRESPEFQIEEGQARSRAAKPDDPQDVNENQADNEATEAADNGAEILQTPIQDEAAVVDGPVENEEEAEANIVDYSKTGPLVHFGSEDRRVLVDIPYGYGTIVILTDPYIVSNGGIRLVDNAQLGLNIVSTDGIVAFDEFHQGYGSDQNRLVAYVSGTPVVPVFYQFCLLAGLVIFSKSRRFARPLPLDTPSRLTKLEYVAAMAQLKKRTRAYDLAIENIFTDFRRRASRLVGVDNHHTSNKALASAVASRIKFGNEEIAALMSRCEDIMHGDTTSKKEVVAVSAKIREIESALGLRRGRAAFYR